MTDVAAEVKDAPVVEKEAEETLTEEVKPKEDEVVENGDSKDEKSENGKTEDEKEEKTVENGSAKEDEVSEEKTVVKDDVCGIKRKSEVGLEAAGDAVESSEKKQKVEETDEPVVASNGVC